VTDRAAGLVAEYGCDTVWFGATAPLALMTRRLREKAEALGTPIRTVVSSTHAHEMWWARTPPSRHALRRIGAHIDHLTVIADYFSQRLGPALAPEDRTKLARLSPSVDITEFTPDADPTPVRERFHLNRRGPVLLAASRLIPRKGQDTLLYARPQVVKAHPGAVLLIVGEGPHERALKKLASRLDLRAHVEFTGNHPNDQMPQYYNAADVFVLPTRTRLGGLEVEGLPTVYLEAAACGLPVVTGKSGGSPESVRDGVTGHVVDGADPDGLARRLIDMLDDPDRLAAMGAASRSWAESEWDWTSRYQTLRTLLDTPVPAALPRSTAPPNRTARPGPDGSPGLDITHPDETISEPARPDDMLDPELTTQPDDASPRR
jgi:phosphatidylinositol alpha-1,6-mannosyltransferase